MRYAHRNIDALDTDIHNAASIDVSVYTKASTIRQMMREMDAFIHEVAARQNASSRRVVYLQCENMGQEAWEWMHRAADRIREIESAVPCGCADRGCPAHVGIADCKVPSVVSLFRSDMSDTSGTRFCQACADDALACGVFYAK